MSSDATRPRGIHDVRIHNITVQATEPPVAVGELKTYR